MTQIPTPPIPCAVLGATGLVGQTFAWLLSRHPWFQLQAVAASDKHDGCPYDDIAWHLPVPRPDAYDLTLQSIRRISETINEGWLVFSALPGTVANKVEPALRKRGLAVFTNSSALRSDPMVPIVIPDVNPDAIADIEKQGFPGSGCIIANSNCAVSGLAIALSPLLRQPVRRIVVTTCQSLSGAGLRGPSALSMAGNIIPHIPGEENKVEAELREILRTEVDIDVTCTRVPTTFGHLASVWVEFQDDVSMEQAVDAWSSDKAPANDLPSLPDRAIVLCRSDDFPQPVHCFTGDPVGMQVFVGRLRSRRNALRFVLSVNNLVRGAAGGSIANAELFVTKYGVKS
jgi:aspartate-semialdehyde dehydrogenase